MKTTCPLLAVAALAGVLNAQSLVLLPDSHHLGESATQAHASGTTSYWGPATLVGRRFQILYDASHFTANGVAGVMTVNNLRFRGEDTEHNVGGQTYTGVLVNVYATSLASAAPLAAAFATNILPATSTLIGTKVFPLVTVAPSIGSAPNNYCIDLDFAAAPAAPFPYDPTAASALFPQVNFLVDITYLTATAAPDPQASTMMQIQDTTGVLALVRARAVFTTVSAVTTPGTLSSLPPVIQVNYAGPGGYPALLPARNERIGAACGGSCSAFYQLFAHDQYFDLKDPGQVDLLSGLTLIPNVYPAPTTYTVVGGAGPINLTGIPGVPLSQADDATLPYPLPLGTNFEYPGGPVGGTAAIRPSTNGYVIVDPASVEVAGDFSPTVLEFLGAAATHMARFCPFWHDFSPNKNIALPFGDPASGLYAVTDPATFEHNITWYRVGRFNSVVAVFQEEHTMQCSLNYMTGVVQFRYGPMGEIWGDTFSGTTSGIVGFTRGQIGGVPSRDPQSRDLSIERGLFSPFTTSVEGATSNMGLSGGTALPVAAGPFYGGRMFGGQSLTWTATNVPAGSVIGILLLDQATTRPGLMVPGITAPGCMLSTSLAALLYEVTLFPPGTVVGVVPLIVPGGYNPGLLGAVISAQYVIADGILGGPNLITVASNTMLHTVGLR